MTDKDKLNAIKSYCESIRYHHRFSCEKFIAGIIEDIMKIIREDWLSMYCDFCQKEVNPYTEDIFNTRKEVIGVNYTCPECNCLLGGEYQWDYISRINEFIWENADLLMDEDIYNHVHEIYSPKEDV